MIRCESRADDTYVVEEALFWYRPVEQCDRMVAMYPDRTEQVIYVRSENPHRRVNERVYVLALALGALIAARRASTRAALHPFD